ncbi:glucosaminidase domain-containing protein [Celerinatantimonas yamalensis]|uniref:Glucosaminidase domain-containing protein n=1 Tax=Celerinatantimonas yamalensis TaxID=559956 RepID=A0ABW9G3A1_9GAMM
MRWLIMLGTVFVLGGCDYGHSSSDWSMPTESIQTSHLPRPVNGEDLQQRKERFSDYLLPMVKSLNLLILKKRSLLLTAQQQYKQKGVLSTDAHHYVIELAKEYSVTLDTNTVTDDTFKQLLLRVDIVPPNLVLAQAANESAWGTSRFAQKGNNLFGQWCFQTGCGIVPSQRADNATHEVRKFRSPFQSLRSYMLNLNTNSAYNKFRILREKSRQAGRTLKGQVLVAGLVNYSSRGAAYVDSLKQLMSTYADLWPATVQAQLNNLD